MSSKQIIKIVSFITSVAFILTNTIYAAPGSNMLRLPMVCGQPASHKQGKDSRFHFELEDIMRSELLELGQFINIIDFDDLLVSSIRISMYKEMLRLGVPEERALAIAKGVVRTESEEDCEMMAAASLIENRNDCAIAGKVGGTYFRFSAVDIDGNFLYKSPKKVWRDVLGKAPNDPSITAERIANELANSIVEAIQNTPRFLKQNIKKVGITVPGQTEDIDCGWGRIAGYGVGIYNINFHNTNLADLIEQALTERGYHGIKVNLKNDAFARLFAELSEKGTLGKNGLNSGTIVVSGTGTNASMAEENKPVTYEGALTELGDTVQANIGFNPSTDTFINMAFELKGRYPKDDVLNKQGLQRATFLVNSSGLSSLANMFGFKSPADAEKAAKEGNNMALKFIEVYGITVGKYIACLVGKNYDKKWSDHIVLVSGVFENFAKGIKISSIVFETPKSISATAKNICL